MARNDFESNYLAHHGILGMKWGIRRYQNPDGSLTPAGRARYGVAEGGSVDDISSAKGISNRTKDLKKAIKKNEKARGKQYTKIANNPENFLGWNKKHAKKIEEHSENIRKGEAEIERLKKKAEEANKQTDGAVIDDRAHAAAKAAGLDQGDNWKIYRDAQAGDKKAQEIINKWESDKKSSDADEYKKVFKEWNNAEQKYYWGTDPSKSKELGIKAEELGRKEAAAQEALRAKGYSDNEIGKMMEEALKEDPSYLKYEEEYHKWRKKNNGI